MRRRIRIAEFATARFCSSESRLRALRNQSRLVFSHGRKNMDRKAVRERHVGRDKVNSAVHQSGDHRGAAREAIEPRYDEPRVVNTAEPERFFDYGSIILSA